MKLTIVNPIQEAIKQTQGLEKIGNQRNWNTVKYCWDCGKNKKVIGGKMFGAFNQDGRGRSGPQRFKCSDCLLKTEMQKK